MTALDKDAYESLNGLVEEVERDLIELERFQNDKNLLDRMLRNLHTFKGTVGMFGLNNLQTVSHKMEDYFKGIEKKKYPITPYWINILAKGVSFLSTELLFAAGRREKSEDCVSLMEVMDKALASPEEAVHMETELSGVEEDVLKEIMQDLQSKRKEDETVSIDAEVFQQILVANSRHREAVTEIKELLAKQKCDGPFSVLKELFESRVVCTSDELSGVINAACLESFDVILSDAPAQSVKMARSLGKSVEVIVYGNEEKVDRYILRELREPLIHILRNCIDHGGQTPDERKALGKMEKNTITIMAMIEEGRLLFSIEDDGRGISVEKIKSRILEKGLSTVAEVDKMSDNQILQFIFQPGFSTTEVATNLSGRGVGMDVVKTNVDKLGGIIEIESIPNSGTTIKFNIPLCKKRS